MLILFTFLPGWKFVTDLSPKCDRKVIKLSFLLAEKSHSRNFSHSVVSHMWTMFSSVELYSSYLKYGRKSLKHVWKSFKKISNWIELIRLEKPYRNLVRIVSNGLINIRQSTDMNNKQWEKIYNVKRMSLEVFVSLSSPVSQKRIIINEVMEESLIFDFHFQQAL